MQELNIHHEMVGIFFIVIITLVNDYQYLKSNLDFSVENADTCGRGPFYCKVVGGGCNTDEYGCHPGAKIDI